MGFIGPPLWKGQPKRKEKQMKKQRTRQMFKATDLSVYETLASVILGYRINTSTPTNNGTPREIKKLLKNIWKNIS
jgi:post-segregation antitoxin (ccd killing protein)